LRTSTSPRRRRVVICGFGNVLRADDGAGPLAVQSLGRIAGGRAATLIGQQLLPEWSAALAEADIAYFVDASFDPQITRFRVTPIGVTSTSRLADPHFLGPAKILGLTASVYHHVPKAYMVEIAARDFGFGQELSPCSQTAVRRVTRWLRARLSRRGRSVGGRSGPKPRRLAVVSRDGSHFCLFPKV